MARIVLSPLINKISGSVGNLVFKKIVNGYSVNIKSTSISRSRLFLNNKLSLVNSISAKWFAITQLERDKYIAASKLYSFTDKFGNQSFLSGRLLFIKLNNINWHRKEQLININAISSIVPIVNILSVSSLKSKEIILKTTGLVPLSSLMVQSRFVKSSLISPKFDRSKVLTVIDTSIVSSVNLYNYIIAQYPYLQSGDYVHIYLTELNYYGFKNIPKFFQVKII